MSACLFTISPKLIEQMTISEIVEKRDEALKILANQPNPENIFECDRWAGNWETLSNIVMELSKREMFRMTVQTKE